MRTCALSGCLVLCLAGGAARADGAFFQLDIAQESKGAVATVERGRLSYGAVGTDYEGGRSVGASVLYRFADGPVALRAGPSVAYVEDDDGPDGYEAGLRVTAERYQPTGFGSVYVLADANTIERAWFLLAQVTFAEPRLSVELSRGGSDSYHETTLAVSHRLGNGPVSLRAGYRYVAEEVFVGVSINTF